MTMLVQTKVFSFITKQRLDNKLPVFTTAAEIPQKWELFIEYEHEMYLCEQNEENNAILSFFS